MEVLTIRYFEICACSSPPSLKSIANQLSFVAGKSVAGSVVDFGGSPPCFVADNRRLNVLCLCIKKFEESKEHTLDIRAKHIN